MPESSHPTGEPAARRLSLRRGAVLGTTLVGVSATVAVTGPAYLWPLFLFPLVLAALFFFELGGLLVTGWLGKSLAGLHLLLTYGLQEAAGRNTRVVEAHLMPVPRVPEARAAVQTAGVRAMMDLSDGLGADLPKLCKASGVGAVVHADRLPVSDNLREAAAYIGRDPVDLAAGGGEDFELLMAVSPDAVEQVGKAVEEATGTRVTEIGEITAGRSVEIERDGERKLLEGGWEHFAG